MSKPKYNLEDYGRGRRARRQPQRRRVDARIVRRTRSCTPDTSRQSCASVCCWSRWWWWSPDVNGAERGTATDPDVRVRPPAPSRDDPHVLDQGDEVLSLFYVVSIGISLQLSARTPAQQQSRRSLCIVHQCSLAPSLPHCMRNDCHARSNKYYFI